MDLRESLGQPVSDYMSHNFVQIRFDDTVTAVALAMQKAGATEAIVMRDGGPIGIVTERDILYKVVATGLDPASVKVREVMSAPVATVDMNEKVIDAIAKMSKMGLRRLGVTKKGKLVGLITQKAMISGELGQPVLLPELIFPGAFKCPYCAATMSDRGELSKHIDHGHLGRGLLEGDVTKW